eukprot:3288278-Prymnesium_polylepis.1
MRLVESKRGAACGSQRSARSSCVVAFGSSVQLLHRMQSRGHEARMPRTTVRTPLGRCGPTST